APLYGGSGLGNYGGADALPMPYEEYSHSLTLTLPPLAAVFLKPDLEKPPHNARPRAGGDRVRGAPRRPGGRSRRRGGSGGGRRSSWRRTYSPTAMTRLPAFFSGVFKKKQSGRRCLWSSATTTTGRLPSRWSGSAATSTRCAAGSIRSSRGGATS